MSKRCDGCAFAEWRRTAAGRLHPDKSGRCNYLIANPLNLSVPAAFYWGAFYPPPKPNGGYIERGVDLPNGRDCGFWKAAA